MKIWKGTVAILILCITVVLGGCISQTTGDSQEDPLSFLKGEMTLTGILTVNNADYGIVFTSPDGKTAKVSFTAPESMNGYIFELAQDGFYVGYDDLRVPFQAATLPAGAGYLFDLLKVRDAEWTKEEETKNEVEMTVYTVSPSADSQMKFYFKKEEATPMRVEFNSHYGNAIFQIQEAIY